MILTFSNPQFVTRILEGAKIHTIRDDKTNRWKVGRKIQFWSGNPRNVKNKPYQFATGICTKVENIALNFRLNTVIISDRYIDNEIDKLNFFAQKDGFENWEEMKNWFCKKNEDHIFYMKLIHFELQ